MACNELTNALAWAQKSGPKEKFPVRVYFTKHFGYSPTATSGGVKDAVHYAHGNVIAVDAPTPYLKGTLKSARNTDGPEMMEVSSTTYDVEIDANGKITYTMMLKNFPGVTTTVQAACVNGVLLTGASGSEVVTVGFTQLPSYTDDVPK